MEIISIKVLNYWNIFPTFVLYKRQIGIMGKRTKNNNNYNLEILNLLATKYGYSVDYIRKCLRGDRTGIMPDAIKKEYTTLENEAKKAIEDKIKKSLDQ
jgi:hypothetical protein